jgi:UDP-glucuronate decarboxylase
MVEPTCDRPASNDPTHGFRIIDLVGSRSNIVSRPLPADDPRQRQPDIAVAKRVLGWQPRTPLREGLKPTIAYFEGLLRDKSVRAAIASEA